MVYLELASLVVNGVFGIFATYMLISLGYFQIRSFKENPFGQGDVTIRNGHLLRIFCIAGTFFACLHFWTVFIRHFVADSDNTCYAFGILWLLTYALGIMCSYIFLWFRQYVINNNPKMPYLRNKKVTVLSYLTLVFLIIGAVMIFLAGSRLIFFSQCSQNPDQARQKLYTIILSGILLSITVIGQLQLLVLFIMPIIKSRQQVGQSVVSESGTSPMDIVHRCIAAAVICTFSDVAAAVVTIVIESSVGQLIYDLNLFVNIICCLASFKNWQKLLNPFEYRRLLARIAMQGDSNTHMSTEVTTTGQ